MYSAACLLESLGGRDTKLTPNNELTGDGQPPMQPYPPQPVPPYPAQGVPYLASAPPEGSLRRPYLNTAL